MKPSLVIIICLFLLNNHDVVANTLNIRQQQTLLLFSIEAQPMSAALAELSSFTQQTILASSDRMKHLKSKEVKGYYTANRALKIMLSGSSLQASFEKNGVILVSEVNHINTPKAVPVLNKVIPLKHSSEINEVVVTAPRSSLQSRFQEKRDAVNVIESIALGDDLHLSEVNLAETLSHIPGISISRDSGEGRQISLRGLQANYSQTRINGLEALFATDSGVDQRGGADRTRGFDFSIFEPELFNQVNVHKSYAAHLDEGAISGTIDLKSKQPFDYYDHYWHSSMQIKGQYNQLKHSRSPHISAFISKRSDNFGVLISMVYAKVDTIEKGFHAWQWTQANFNEKNIADSVAPEVTQQLINNQGEDRVFVPVGNSLSAWGNIRERLGMNSALQWQVSDNNTLSVNVLLGKLKNNRTHYQLATAGSNGLIGDVRGQQVLTDAEIINQDLLYVKFDQLDLRTEHQRQQTETSYYQVSISDELTISHNLTANFILGVSHADFSSPINDKLFLESKNQQVELDWRSGLLESHYGFDLTRPEQWALMRSDVREDAFDNRFHTFKSDFSYQIAQQSSFEFGVHAKQYSSAGWERRSRVDWRQISDAPKANFTLTSLPLVQDYTVADHQATFDTIVETGLQSRELTAVNNRAGTVYNIEENTLAAYGEYQTQGTLFNNVLSSNIGVRWFTTKQSASGELNEQLSAKILDKKRNYSAWLPSINLSYQLTPDWLMRFAANRNISRPNLNQLRASADINVADLSIKLGNPNLKQFTANSLDLSFEYYAEQGHGALSFFYKSLDDHIIEQSVNKTYRETGLPLAFLAEDSRRTPESEFTVVQSVNGGNAYVKGIELSLNAKFPIPFQHFGISSNISLTDGKTTIIKNNQQIATQPPGLSTLVHHSRIYYDNDDWGVSLSATYRDKFITSVGQAQNQVEGFDESLFVDFSSFCRINKQVELTLDVNNVTNETLRQFQDHRTLVSVQSGRQITVGLKYTLN
ncbi:TonB-dependent receptor [Pseudocolwellia agarivorans]|uniref:TonB-dependent receptor n=1 Tax=Pseudocolwellia agarivorans TaxID=1911682 RepID=UPI00158BDC72|nr:TonB-dependent receptor [Pseudocolwellia agarivorans]